MRQPAHSRASSSDEPLPPSGRISPRVPALGHQIGDRSCDAAGLPRVRDAVARCQASTETELSSIYRDRTIASLDAGEGFLYYLKGGASRRRRPGRCLRPALPLRDFVPPGRRPRPDRLAMGTTTRKTQSRTTRG
jgi:hypothetical protein